MLYKILFALVIFFMLSSCVSNNPPEKVIGRFNADKDLFLPQFDCKTDTDDLHSAAGVATMLVDPRLSGVNYHAVAGAYGIQEGLYVPADTLFQTAFGDQWSDAHSNYDQALDEVTQMATNALKDSGNIWIAEAGQSDFTADLIRNIRKNLPSVNTVERIHVVQHSDWNENQTTPEDLAYVKANGSYHRIPDGNVMGNGSPGFYHEEKIHPQDYLTDSKLLEIWQLAIDTANKYNGKDERHNNPAIAAGGLDFSDVSETCWIFGFDRLADAEAFFKEFSKSNNLSH